MTEKSLAEVNPVGDKWLASVRIGNRWHRAGWYATEQEARQAVEEFRQSYEEEDRRIKQAIAKEERQKSGLKEYTVDVPCGWMAAPVVMYLAVRVVRRSK